MSIITKNVNAIVAILLSFGCLFSFSYTRAQQQEIPATEIREDFSDQELKSFIRAHEKVSAIQQESESKMISAIQEQGMSVDRFNEILKAQQDPAGNPEISPEELQSFNTAAEFIVLESKKTEMHLVNIIENEGIEVDTFNAIMVAYEQNQKVKARIIELIGHDY